MLLDDLVLVSVDDHVVEPPDMFEGRLPVEVRRPRTPGARARGRHRGLAVRRDGRHQHRSQRRGRPAGRGVRDRADLVRGDPRRAATTSTSGSGTWTRTGSSARCASRRSRISAASSSPGRPRTVSSVSPCSGRTTTGTSTTGAGLIRARFIPLGARADLGPGADGGRGAAGRSERLPTRSRSRRTRPS